MENDLDFEAAYWGDCTRTLDEENKQFVYARYMGLRSEYPYRIDAPVDQHFRVLDVGGGPTSMALKLPAAHVSGTVVDPLMSRFPPWVRARYLWRRLMPVALKGEDMTLENVGLHEEVWLYNVLQHTEDPAKVVANALALGSVLRFFEWCFIPPHEGHPHEITPDLIQSAIGGAAMATGRALTTTVTCNQPINELGCVGHAFAGIVRPA